MAKKGIETKNGIPVRCEYCLHNQGENQRFKYMWHCSHLSFCVVFGLRYCEAKKNGKGDFEIDNEKYKKWEYINSEK
ncbi:hypothetical protein [Dysgonomonas sp. 25]|uniref:hypothetical protein n=1 Tax=Dysgonomonas sp. 25 TaxID=2302933 RepID=UPI0013D6498F|nr:hypothetical protein [Dysgonomonas sp. 25]NDV68564.1 hypothetical protein [Dysgonomonas sp. 25]